MKIFSPINQFNLSFPPVKFSNNNITRSSHLKHLGVVLDSNLNFNTHIDQKIKKCDKIIGLARRLSVKVPRNALQYINLSRDLILTKVMSYMINQAMMIFQSKMVKVQYRACLAITGGHKELLENGFMMNQAYMGQLKDVHAINWSFL